MTQIYPYRRLQSRGLAGPTYPDHCGVSRNSAQCAVKQLRPHLRNAGRLPYWSQPLMNGLYGLNGLMGQAYGRENVVDGSQVRVGFEYRVNRDSGYDMSALHNFPNAIATCLYPYNYFKTVQAAITSGWINDYATISGIVEGDYLFSEDIGELVHQALLECFPFITINKRDPVIVDAIPSQYAGDPDVAQPGGYTPQQAMTTTAPKQPMTGAPQTTATPRCPPGYQDVGWFSVDCQPIGAKKADYMPYLILGGAVILAIALKG